MFLPLLVSALASAVPDPCPHDRAVAVEVVSELGDAHDDAAMHAFVSERLPARAADEGVCIDPAAPRRVVITIAWSDAARGSYAIHLRASSPELDAPVELPAGTCDGCSTAEIVGHSAWHLPAALAALAPPPEPPAPASLADAPTSEPAASEVDAVRDRQPPRLSRLGRAGIGIAVVGTAAIATGVGLWAQGDVVHPRDASYRLSLRPVGISLVLGGLAATAAGGAMLGVDLHERRRLAIAPAVQRHRIGVAITGRF